MVRTLSEPGEQVRDVHCTEDTPVVGRTIIFPLTSYARLLGATTHQRAHWRVSGGGYGIPLAGH